MPTFSGDGAVPCDDKHGLGGKRARRPLAPLALRVDVDAHGDVPALALVLQDLVVAVLAVVEGLEAHEQELEDRPDVLGRRRRDLPRRTVFTRRRFRARFS